MKTLGKRYLLTLIATILFGVGTPLHAIRPLTFANDNATMYQASHFHGRHPDLRARKATTIELTYANGSTKRGSDVHGHKQRLFDIYGLTNLLQLTEGVSTVPANVQALYDNYNNSIAPLITALDALQINPGAGTIVNFNSAPAAAKIAQIGPVGFKGKFEVDDVHLHLRQNFGHKYFFEVDLPINKLRVTQVALVNESPTEIVNINAIPGVPAVGPLTLEQTAEQARRVTAQAALDTLTSSWDAIRNGLNTIVNAYEFKDFDAVYDNNVSLGDIRMYAGMQDTTSTQFDFIKSMMFTARIGLVLPTGHNRNVDYVFAVPNGYNGHVGIPARLDVSAQLKHNIHVGGHIGGTYFFDNSRLMRVRTGRHQTGWIRLEKARLGEKMGMLFFTGFYGMLQNFIGGISFLAGYSYNVQGSRTVSAEHTPCIDNEVCANDDPTLRGWDNHVAHFNLEADLRSTSIFRKSKWAPYLRLFYNYQFSGKSNFTTSTGGGTLGSEMRWKF